MAISFGELKSKILRALNDPAGATYTNDLVLDAVSGALDAILPWYSSRSKYFISRGDGEDGDFQQGKSEFVMPSDCYQVEMVYDDRGSPIRSAILSPDFFRGVSQQGNDWIEYPDGVLSFSKAPESDLVVYYLSFLPKPTDDNSMIAVPTWYITGIVYWSMAYCLIPSGISSAVIRQFNQRVDSGTPEDNPLATRVRELLKLFEIEMNRAQARAKASRV